MPLSDIEIRNRCQEPEYAYSLDQGKTWLPYYDDPATGRGSDDIMIIEARLGEDALVAYYHHVAHYHNLNCSETAGIHKPMISPYESDLVRERITGKVISYGQSSYGYDMVLGTSFKRLAAWSDSQPLDPKHVTEDDFISYEAEIDDRYPAGYRPVIVPANGFLLGVSKEHFNMPRDITGVVMTKSTYARVGLLVLCTPLEAGWSGYLTLEFANTTPRDILIYPGEGIGQVIFERGAECYTSYAERDGKYMHQPNTPVIGRV